MHSFWSNFKRGAFYTIWHLTTSLVSWYVNVYIGCAVWHWFGTNAYCYIPWIPRDKSLSTIMSFLFWECKTRTGSSLKCAIITIIIIIIMEQCRVKHAKNYIGNKYLFMFFRTQPFKNIHTHGEKNRNGTHTNSPKFTYEVRAQICNYFTMDAIQYHNNS